MKVSGLSWEEFNFSNTMIVSAMAQLSEMKKNVRLVASVGETRIFQQTNDLCFGASSQIQSNVRLAELEYLAL